jgi:hypothetical protein
MRIKAFVCSMLWNNKLPLQTTLPGCSLCSYTCSYRPYFRRLISLISSIPSSTPCSLLPHAAAAGWVRLSHRAAAAHYTVIQKELALGQIRSSKILFQNMIKHILCIKFLDQMKEANEGSIQAQT